MKKKGKKEDEIKLEDLYSKIAITGSIFLGIFVLFLVSGDFTTSVVYRGYGLGYSQDFDILELYYTYPSVFDLTIFLLIFLGIGQSVLGEHLKEGGSKATYVGLGIFLALALLLWERQTGYNLLENFGPWAFFIILILLAITIFRYVEAATTSVLIATGIAYLVFYFFYTGVIESFVGGSFLSSYLPGVNPLLELGFWTLGVGAIVWGIIKKATD